MQQPMQGQRLTDRLADWQEVGDVCEVAGVWVCKSVVGRVVQTRIETLLQACKGTATEEAEPSGCASPRLHVATGHASSFIMLLAALRAAATADHGASVHRHVMVPGLSRCKPSARASPEFARDGMGGAG